MTRTAVFGAALTMFVVVSVLPIAYLLFTSIPDLSVAALLVDARQRGLLYNTAVLGVSTALGATALGVPLGLTLARVPLGHKRAIRLALAAPILLPPYVAGLAWIYLGRSIWLLSEWTYTLTGAIVVLSLVLYPFSMLATELAARRVDGRLEEAGLVVSPPSRVLLRITLPLAAPTIVAAALVIFVQAVSEFGIPGLLRVRVYTTEVFTAFAALYDFPRAILLALPLLLLCVIVAGFAAILLGERRVTGRRHTRTHAPLVDKWRRPAAVLALVVVAIALGVPLAVLAREALGARSVSSALAGSGPAILNSLVLSAAGATGAVAIAIWLGYAHARAGRRLAHLADVVLVGLFAVPSTIVGVGLIGVWNRPGPLGAVYGSHAMLLLADLARFVPVAVLILAASTRYIPVSQEEAAAVSGAGWWRTMWRVVLPQMRPGVAGAWLIAFVLAFGELGVSILVAPPGEATLPIRTYTMIANAPPSQVAALALLQALVIFTPLALAGASPLRQRTR